MPFVGSAAQKARLDHFGALVVHFSVRRVQHATYQVLAGCRVLPRQPNSKHFGLRFAIFECIFQHMYFFSAAYKARPMRQKKSTVFCLLPVFVPRKRGPKVRGFAKKTGMKILMLGSRQGGKALFRTDCPFGICEHRKAAERLLYGRCLGPHVPILTSIRMREGALKRPADFCTPG